MMTCSRCNNVVDETTNAACPHCSAPLNRQAVPSAARPGARVSLTGEVIEDAAPAAQQPLKPGDYAGGSAGSPPVFRPGAPGTSRPAGSGYRKEAAPDNSDRNAGLLKIALLLIFLLAGSGGGWWYWTHRTTPDGQVKRYLHAVQWLDWGVVYDLSTTPPANKTRIEFIHLMNDKFDDNPVLKINARKRFEKVTFEVGKPSVTGAEATVPVTASMFGMSLPLSFKLQNFGGVWKVEPMTDNPLALVGVKEEKEPAGGMPVIPPIPGQ